MIKQELEKLARTHNMSLTDIENALKDAKLEEKNSEIKAKIAGNKELIGKCFRTKTKYIKVISEYSSNEYRVECLTFPILPEIKTQQQTHMVAFPGDFIFASTKLDTFKTESMLASVLRKSKHIPESAFDEEAIKHTEKLLEIAKEN